MTIFKIGLPAIGLAAAAFVLTAAGPPRTERSVDSLGRPPNAIDRDTHPGRALFKENCAMCHEGNVPKAPHREFLQTMAPETVQSALTDGIMRQQAAHLSPEQRNKIVEYLAGISLADYKPAPGAVMCEGKARDFDLGSPPAMVGWGYDTRRFVPAGVAGLTAREVPRLKLKWAFAFPGALRARSQPVVAMGAVFVGSQDGTVYAFDLKSGCARWTRKVSAEVRTAIVVEPWEKQTPLNHHPRLFFGDLLGKIYALDALTGEIVWQTKPEEHPNVTITGSPVALDDTVLVPISSLEVITTADPKYPCCSFRGSVVALDMDSGAERWRHYTIPQPPAEHGRTKEGTPILGPSGAPVWGSPAVDRARGVIYHGSGENYSSPADDNSDALFAVDYKTGKRKWAFQLTPGDAWNMACTLAGNPNCPAENGPDFDLAASPMLVDIGGGRQAVIAGQKSGDVYAVDPDTGKRIWKTSVGRGSIQGGIHFGMAAEGGVIFVGINDMPMLGDGSSSQDRGHPGIHALDAATGKFLWRVEPPDRCENPKMCGPGISAAITAMPGVVFAGHLDGYFRAYDSHDGTLLWEVDTKVPQKAVNGVMAHGGAMSGPGAAIANGYVITNSGYDFGWRIPGNALLVYSVDGK